MKCQRCKEGEAYATVAIEARFLDDYEEEQHREEHRVCYPCGRDIIEKIAAEAHARKDGAK